MTKTSNKFCPYETITGEIIKHLENGCVPWRAGWDQMGALPRSMATGKPYTGINSLLLGLKGYTSPYWATFKKIKELGGAVKKGSSSSPACFFKWSKFKTKDPETGEEVEKMVPIFKVYRVFNLEQCEGLNEDKLPEQWDGVKAGTDWIPADIAEDIIKEAVTGKLIPAVNHDGGGRAFYRPGTDSIHMPERDRFETPNAFYGTLFHEAVHATGHSTRLNRALDTEPKPFGSKDYSREELVAEIGSCFLMYQAGLEPDYQNSSAYIEGWLKVLKGNKKLIPTASAQASKAHRWIIGEYQSI